MTTRQGSKQTIRAGRRSVEISRPDKVLFPDGITKRDLVDYYVGVAPVMLPHVRDRPMTLERFPDGIGAGRVFSKDIPAYFPQWIARKKLRKAGGTVTHVVCNETATLAYLANQACITMHVGPSRVDDIDCPDQLVFDLDPSGSDVPFLRSVSHEIKDLLEAIGLVPFVKTSGSKGLHVTVPLDGRSAFDEVRTFALEAARVVAARRPDDVTLEQRKDKRGGRLFLDWFRNSYGATVVAPWSVRPLPGAPVAVPLAWEEIDERGFSPQRFGMKDALQRAREPDPWKGWRRRARALGPARTRLERLGL